MSKQLNRNGMDGAGGFDTAFHLRAHQCLYNKEGLGKYFASLGRTSKRSDGTGAGGVNIVCLGDSDTQGNGPEFTNVGARQFQTYPHLLSRYLQPALNPPGVVGGYGPYPLDKSGSNRAGTPDTATAASSGVLIYDFWNITPGGGGGTGGGAGAFTVMQPDTAQRYVLYDFNYGSDADAMAKRLYATQIRLVGPGNGVAALLDAYAKPGTSSPIAIGTGSYLAATAYGGYAGGSWGARTAILDVNGGAGPTGDWRIQVYNPSSVTLYSQYLVLFNGDTDCGIQVGNMGMSGMMAKDWASATDSQTALGAFAYGDGTTDTNCGLVIIMLGKNDIGGSRTKAQFKANIETLVAAVKTWNTAPAVLLVSAIPRYDASYADSYITYMDYIAAMQEICIADPANVAFWDLWGMIDYVRPQDAAGVMQSDAVHMSAAFHNDVIAPGLASILIPSAARGM